MFIQSPDHVAAKGKLCADVANKCATSVVRIIMMAHVANLVCWGLLCSLQEIILRTVQAAKVEFSKFRAVITVFVLFVSMCFVGSVRKISKALIMVITI